MPDPLHWRRVALAIERDTLPQYELGVDRVDPPVTFDDLNRGLHFAATGTFDPCEHACAHVLRGSSILVDGPYTALGLANVLARRGVTMADVVR